MKFRKATEKDVIKIVEMLADDELGKTRENFQIPLPNKYRVALRKLDVDTLKKTKLILKHTNFTLVMATTRENHTSKKRTNSPTAGRVKY